MLKRETMKVMLAVSLIVGSVSLIDSLLPSLDRSLRGIFVLILAFSSIFLAGRLVPVKESVKSNAFSGFMAVTSFVIAWLVNNWINEKFYHLNHSSITDGIYSMETLFSFLIAMVFFGISYWSFLKIYHSFEREEE